MRVARAAGLLVAPALVLALLPACSATTREDHRLRIVASTDVYGAIARAVAGRRAQITSLIDDPAQDPHAFEASVRDQLAVSKAEVIVENGGGYDDFVDRMRAASSAPGAAAIVAVRLFGAHPPANEHVFYDLPTMARLAERLAGVLSARRPGARAAFRAGADRFVAGVHALERVAAGLRARYAGTRVVVTEPVANQLLRACGLVDATPPAFSSAVEADTDVSASVLHDTLELVSSGTVHALVYNVQSAGAETQRLRADAAAHHVPQVPVRETLPSGAGYLTWMRSNLTALAKALSR
jgi:zinc/manganese transport system substrate-binding protein